MCGAGLVSVESVKAVIFVQSYLYEQNKRYRFSIHSRHQIWKLLWWWVYSKSSEHSSVYRSKVNPNIHINHTAIRDESDTKWVDQFTVCRKHSITYHESGAEFTSVTSGVDSFDSFNDAYYCVLELLKVYKSWAEKSRWTIVKVSTKSVKPCQICNTSINQTNRTFQMYQLQIKFHKISDWENTVYQPMNLMKCLNLMATYNQMWSDTHCYRIIKVS